jgi:Cu/Zn superoxide dismutase
MQDDSRRVNYLFERIAEIVTQLRFERNCQAGEGEGGFVLVQSAGGDFFPESIQHGARRVDYGRLPMVRDQSRNGLASQQFIDRG